MFIVPVVRVGNSRGIRIPKKVLDAIGSPDAGMTLRAGKFLISPKKTWIG
jgi:antitoxin component of MazEF toxin-antitoxin module